MSRALHSKSKAVMMAEAVVVGFTKEEGWEDDGIQIKVTPLKATNKIEECSVMLVRNLVT